jgi:hypothetical protein
MYGTAEAAAAIYVFGVAGKQLLTADAAGDVASGLGISLLFAGSTNNLKCFRKSTPMIRKLTAASKKFQANRQRPNSRCTRRPQLGIFVSPGPTNAGPDGVPDE